MHLKINFRVKFCSRYTHPEVCATKDHEKKNCAAETWPLRAPSARTWAFIYGGRGVMPIFLLILNGKEQAIRDFFDMTCAETSFVEVFIPCGAAGFRHFFVQFCCAKMGVTVSPFPYRPSRLAVLRGV